MALPVNLFIMLIYCGSALTIIHSLKFRGIYKTLAFILGLWIVTAGIENINVLFGGYYYPPGGWTIWIYNCPLWAPLGWLICIYCSNFVSHSLIGNAEGSFPVIGIGTEPKNGVDKRFLILTIKRALFTAYAAVLVDFIMDPVGANLGNKWWIWQVDNIYLFGIPFGNYIGWVLVIFWTILFYDIIMAWGSTKNKKKVLISSIWSVASVVAMLLAGSILMGFTFWFGMDGIRTGNNIPLDITITSARFISLLITTIIILISMGLVVATFLLPNKLPDQIPKSKRWYVLPSFVILGFWSAMLIIGFFTSFLLVAVGIIYGIPLLWIHSHYIHKIYKVEGNDL